MYLILSDLDGNATSSRASEVFHDEVDVIGLRASGEGKVYRRRFVEENPTEKIRYRRSTREGLMEKGCRRREGPLEKIC